MSLETSSTIYSKSRQSKLKRSETKQNEINAAFI